MAAPLSRHVRAVLQGVPDALPPTELLLLVDDFVANCSSSTDQLFQLEDDLQAIHHEIVNHSSLHQTETFIAVLHHIRTLLSSSSIISIWFDLVLRPALREPKLPTTAIKHARELIVSALNRSDQSNPDKVPEFRRRLLDLYLLDAFNDSSGDDAIEWAQLDLAERERRIHWKQNLEQILLVFGTERPLDLMTEIQHSFIVPSCRLQLLTFLNTYLTDRSFPLSASKILASHPLMSSLLNSLLLDNSSTVCAIGLNLLVHLCPVFAVEACEQLKSMLPTLLVILARMLCWKERTSSYHDILAEDGDEYSDEEELDPAMTAKTDTEARPNIDWERLDLAFPTVTPYTPPLRRYFTILYYLFPCNVLIFLRTPIAHLTQHQVKCPFELDWEDAFDEDEIRSKSERLLRCHTCHPSIIWRDATAELSLQDIWTRYDVARIVSESMMLDIENGAWNLSNKPSASEGDMKSRINNQTSLPCFTSITLSTDPPQISLQDMIATSVALKSDVKVDITTKWPSTLFPTIPSSPAANSVILPTEAVSTSKATDAPAHANEAIAGLQREILLLRNELNFELWVSRENVKHIGRLYQDHILSRSAEAERQGLHNTFRKYRSQVNNLHKDIREQKVQALVAKNKYSDWNSELSNRLRELREEKKTWIREAAVLRTAEKETQARFVAQSKLLGEATTRVFELETEIRAFKPRVDRLRDFEQQIEQHVRMQRLWDKDFETFNKQKEDMEVMKSRYKQMELRLESLEKTLAEVEGAGRVYRRHIQSMEAHHPKAVMQDEDVRQIVAKELAGLVAEKTILLDTKKQLRERNAELMEELEEMRAMVEVLKGQISRRKGLVSDPRASPTLG